MASAPAFQAGNAGSIPVVRSIKSRGSDTPIFFVITHR